VRRICLKIGLAYWRVIEVGNGLIEMSVFPLCQVNSFASIATKTYTTSQCHYTRWQCLQIGVKIVKTIFALITNCKLFFPNINLPLVSQLISFSYLFAICCHSFVVYLIAICCQWGYTKMIRDRPPKAFDRNLTYAYTKNGIYAVNLHPAT